jgi:hypothetical protein
MQTDTDDVQISCHFGLSTSGRLYRGSDLVAEHVTSTCIRRVFRCAVYCRLDRTCIVLPLFLAQAQ